MSTILFSAQVIQKRIDELALQIASDYKGKKVVLVCVLSGAYIFASDLQRALWKKSLDTTIDFVAISSYGNKKMSSGKPLVLKDISHSLTEAHVLIVEDVVDTGITLDFLTSHMKQKNPLSVKICTLLSKESRREKQLNIAYIGFTIAEDLWVEGYGLDTDGLMRGCPDIMAR